MTGPIGSKGAAPNEARHRKRIRNQIAFVSFANIIGGSIDFLTDFDDKAKASFSTVMGSSSLDQPFALCLAAALLFSFVALHYRVSEWSTNFSETEA